MADYTSQFSDFSNMPQYDLARQRAVQQNAADKQANLDALQRRFANLGNLNSGAQLKQEENLNNQSAVNLANANEGINAQQQAEILRRKEVLQGQEFSANQANLQRQFQTGERIGGQEFQAGQAGEQRKFQTGERIGSQEFQGAQNQASRDLQRNQFVLGLNEEQAQNAIKNKQFEQSFGQQQTQFNKTYALSKSQLDNAQTQFDQTYKEEVRVDSANMEFAKEMLAKQGWVEGTMAKFSNIGDVAARFGRQALGDFTAPFR